MRIVEGVDVGVRRRLTVLVVLIVKLRFLFFLSERKLRFVSHDTSEFFTSKVITQLD